MDNPLVSVCIFVRNCTNYIIETLDSVRSQSYKNIELIISEDCSTDGTLCKCEEWVNRYGQQFVRCLVLKSTVNTGTSATLNRAIKAAKGEWIKSLAGDDILLPSSIATYVDQLQHYPDISVFFALHRPFHVAINGNKNIGHPDERDIKKFLHFNTLTPREQYLDLLQSDCRLSAPTLFIRKNVVDKYPFNELYRFMEDYPMWVVLTKAGYKLQVLTEPTVLYRIHDSLSNNVRTYFSPNFFQTKHVYFWNEQIKYFQEEHLEKEYDRQRKVLLINDLIDGMTDNHKSKWNSLKIRLICWLINRFLVFRFPS